MSTIAIRVSYLQSLLWLALFMALAAAETNIVQLMLLDFVHGNPHRTLENALFMMEAYAPPFGIIAFIGTLLVFTLPQLFQAEWVGALDRLFGDRARFVALPALPLTTLLTWYCYDYLTPSAPNFAGNLTVLYEHGLSLSRYTTTMAIQMPVTLFGLLYLNAHLSGRSKRPLLLAALAITLVAGGIRGYLMARGQFQFL